MLTGKTQLEFGEHRYRLCDTLSSRIFNWVVINIYCTVVATFFLSFWPIRLMIFHKSRWPVHCYRSAVNKLWIYHSVTRRAVSCRHVKKSIDGEHIVHTIQCIVYSIQYTQWCIALLDDKRKFFFYGKTLWHAKLFLKAFFHTWSANADRLASIEPWINSNLI